MESFKTTFHQRDNSCHHYCLCICFWRNVLQFILCGCNRVCPWTICSVIQHISSLEGRVKCCGHWAQVTVCRQGFRGTISFLSDRFWPQVLMWMERPATLMSPLLPCTFVPILCKVDLVAEVKCDSLMTNEFPQFIFHIISMGEILCNQAVLLSYSLAFVLATSMRYLYFLYLCSPHPRKEMMASKILVKTKLCTCVESMTYIFPITP